MIHSIQCPHCQAVLKSPTPVPAGKQVKCPKCKQMFTTGEPRTESPPSPAPPTPVPNDPFAEDDEMAAAIAKLEADQAAGAKPAPAPVPAKPTPAPKYDEDAIKAAAIAARGGKWSGKKGDPGYRDEPEETESDDDLVEPDEDQPVKKKKRKNDDEDEKPRSKKKRAADEDDEDDEPKSKKQRREDDDEEASSKDGKKKRKTGGSVVMLTVLLGGGILGLLACCGCGVGGYFLFFSNPMLGKWESKIGNLPATQQWNFGAFGSGTVKSTVVNPFTKQKEETTAYFDYKFTRGDPATLEITETKVEGKNANLGDIRGERTRRFKVVFRDGDAVLSVPDLPPIFGDAGLVLRRPR